MKYKIGLSLAGVYALISLYFIATQGLTGESFISLILGMPWTLALAAVEFGGMEGLALKAALVIPMALNAVILYLIGSRIERAIRG